MTSLKPYITLKTYIAILGIICLLAINGVSAKVPVHKDDGEVSTMLTAGSKDAILAAVPAIPSMLKCHRCPPKRYGRNWPA